MRLNLIDGQPLHNVYTNHMIHHSRSHGGVNPIVFFLDWVRCSAQIGLIPRLSMATPLVVNMRDSGGHHHLLWSISNWQTAEVYKETIHGKKRENWMPQKIPRIRKKTIIDAALPAQFGLDTILHKRRRKRIKVVLYDNAISLSLDIRHIVANRSWNNHIIHAPIIPGHVFLSKITCTKLVSTL